MAPRLLDSALDASLLGFSRVGAAVRRRAWSPIPADALAEKTVLVTGSTRGIGRAAAEGLASLGASVVIVGRNEERIAAAVDEIASSTGADVIGERADLSLMAEVRSLADRLAARSIDVLVNNAGALFPERWETAEGIEATFALNLLGHYVLTERLIPSLASSGRIINVSSGGMYTQRISSSDLEARNREYDGRVQYAKTKRGQVILTEIWAERLAERGVSVHAMHPGWVNTPGVETGLPLFHSVMRPILRTPEQGADTIVWLAAADPSLIGTGGFWHDRRRRPTHRLKRTRETPEQRQRFLAGLEAYAG